MRSSAVRLPAILVAAALVLSGCTLDALRAGSIAEAKVLPLDQPNSWLPGLVGLPDFAASGLGPVGYPNVVATSTELDPTQEFLAAIGLQASDFSTEATIQLIRQGDTLAGATLDFCGGVYESEDLRLARRQVVAIGSDGNPLGFSSEAVQYESPEAAQQAIDEMVAQKLKCPNGTSYTADDGVSYELNFYPAPGPAATILVPAKQRVILNMTKTSTTSKSANFLALQIRGNTLVAIYASMVSDSQFDQTTLDSLFGLVSATTQRLLDASPEDIGQF